MKIPLVRAETLRRISVAAAASLLLAQQALATWSIVVVDTHTREVCVATATCLENLDIQKIVPVVVPEKGGGASQSLIDAAAINRRIIWRGLLTNHSPQEILNQLTTLGGYQSRQFGIVNMDDAPATFTGSNAGQAAGGVTGIAGSLRYAIQGNVLTGPEVWLAAESALLQTPGDLSQKVMAAMSAAREYGGDGRCSCSPSAPTSCGSPPPNFTKSAHIACVVVARVGDALGDCNSSLGCANGSYYLGLNFIGNAASPDPVRALQEQYAAWRAAQQGRPDQVHSIVLAGAHSLVADGVSQAKVFVKLYDIEGQPLAQGGLQIGATNLAGPASASQLTGVLDHGDGSYTLTFQAGTQPGQDVWRIAATDAVGKVVLQPDVPLRVDPLTELHCGFDWLSASQAYQVPLTLNFGAGLASEPYIVLGSFSGTSPGATYLGLHVPLNRDRLTILTRSHPNQLPLINTAGVLDPTGRAEAALAFPPDFLVRLVGYHLDWAALQLGSAPSVSGPAGFYIVP